MVILLTAPLGMSAATSARKVGAAALPVVGPAKTRLADCVALVTASVPEVVTGVPETENSAGMVSPTLVTVPEPPAAPPSTKSPRPSAIATWPTGIAASPCVISFGPGPVFDAGRIWFVLIHPREMIGNVTPPAPLYPETKDCAPTLWDEPPPLNTVTIMAESSPERRVGQQALP